LIYGWRKVFNNPDMPFHFVQLAPYRYNRPEALPGIWQAQLKTLAVKNTGMAVTVDIGNTRDIHPKNKQEVGRRLALWALTKDYGRDVGVYSGPLLSKVDQSEGKGRITVHFQKQTTGGLKASDGKPLSHFEIAGKDGKWHAAKADIVYGDHLIVSSDAVKEPIHVRYGWNELAEPNLVNGAGLPASPFQASLK
ncbi:MAG: sialate O-acetylesterase, partial [Planctomycetaceae bacterium]|nr:sialate O-acetylesterase [Planctomycetaceae bacterium]